MTHSLNVLLLFFKLHVSTAVFYRINLLGGIFSTILWMVLSIVGISVLTYQVPEIGGWNRFELLAVQGVYSIVLGFTYFAFGESLKKLSQSVNRGDLDFKLLKPMDSQFMVSFGELKLYQLARVLGGVLLLIYSVHNLQLSVHLLDIGLLILYLSISCAIVYSIWFILTTLSIWLINMFNLNELIIQITGLTRYPLEIVRHVRRELLYLLLPLVVVTTVPAQIITQQTDWSLALWGVVTAIILLFVSRKFWHFALMYYTSASS